MQKIKVIVDTDIGGDIDDAECLAYLTANPQCDLLGITTVYGMPIERAKIASAICKAAGKQIPIHPGAETAMCSPELWDSFPHQNEKLVNWPHDMEFEEYSAIEFLRNTILENPHEITLLAIGPLTNIGTLFAAYPETVPLLKELVIMGGDFLHDDLAVECNIQVDPYAAKIVFDSGVPMRCAGFNVTRKLPMEMDEFQTRFNMESLKPVYDFAQVWFSRGARLTIFHDPLAAALIFKPDICTFKRGRVKVIAGGKDAGKTYFTEGEGNHFVAATVNPEAFFEHYFSITSK